MSPYLKGSSPSNRSLLYYKSLRSQALAEASFLDDLINTIIPGDGSATTKLSEETHGIKIKTL